MGICYYLVKNRTREVYDLGKFTGDWEEVLGSPGHGVPFVVTASAPDLAAGFAAAWEGIAAPPDAGYFRLVAEDLVRWCGQDPVYCTTDGSFDGWWNPDGSHDDGRFTGSRYSSDHPEWPRATKPAVLDPGLVHDVTEETMRGDDAAERALNAFLTRRFVLGRDVPSDECLGEARAILRVVRELHPGDPARGLRRIASFLRSRFGVGDDAEDLRVEAEEAWRLASPG